MMSAYLGKVKLPWAKIKPGYTSIPPDTEASLARGSEERSSGDGFLEKRRHEWGDEAPPTIWKNRQFLAAHFMLFAIYLFILLFVTNGKSISMRKYGMPYCMCQCSILQSFRARLLTIFSREAPAVDAVAYEETYFTLEDRIQEGGVFSGKPRPELDRAWHDLLNSKSKFHTPLWQRTRG